MLLNKNIKRLLFCGLLFSVQLQSSFKDLDVSRPSKSELISDCKSRADYYRFRAGMDVDVRDSYDCPLVSDEGDPDTVMEFLKFGIILDVKSHEYRLEKIIELAKLEVKNNTRNSSPLFLALYNEYVDVAYTLVQKGTDVNDRDYIKRTALHYISQGHISDFVGLFEKNKINENSCENLVKKGFAKLLINDGIDVNARDCVNRTALHYAAQSASGEMVKILINNGADINVIDNQGFTPLNFALHGKYLSIAKDLVKAGADKGDKDENGLTEYDYQVKRERSNLLLTLKVVSVVLKVVNFFYIV